MPTAPPPVPLRLSLPATATCQTTAQTRSSAQDPAAPLCSHFWTSLTGRGKSGSDADSLFRIQNNTLQLVIDNMENSHSQNVKVRGQCLKAATLQQSTHTQVLSPDCVRMYRVCLIDSPLTLLLILLHLLEQENCNPVPRKNLGIRRFCKLHILTFLNQKRSWIVLKQ